MLTKLKNSSLIIFAHGSLENEYSSLPTEIIKNKIQKKNIFKEVLSGYWKEEPSFRDSLRMATSQEIFIVPNFISNGFFTKQIIPAEINSYIEMNNKYNTNKINNKKIKLCSPVGLHKNLSKILYKKAISAIKNDNPEKYSLIIVGHGTFLNKSSRKNIETKVNEIKKIKPSFAQVIPSFLEEKPLISDWYKNTNQNKVIVVPFFISDGLHSFEDIPELLGINQYLKNHLPNNTKNNKQIIFKKNPYYLYEKKLIYTTSLGASSQMANLIIKSVTDQNNEKPITPITTLL